MQLKYFLSKRKFLLYFLIVLNLILIKNLEIEKNKDSQDKYLDKNQDEKLKILRQSLIDEDLNGSLSIDQLNEFINVKDFDEEDENEGFDMEDDQREFNFNFGNEGSMLENNIKNIERIDNKNIEL